MVKLMGLKKQSAFSLIETLVGLLLLSLGIMGSGKLLLISETSYQTTLQRQQLNAIAYSIAESCYFAPDETKLSLVAQYWQSILNNIIKGGLLNVYRKKIDEKWLYTVVIEVERLPEKRIELEIVV